MIVDDDARGLTQPGAIRSLSPNATAVERMQFTGRGGEYFRIWIVNVLLTVITLGIYSAWAKVRRLQYFYRHTRLAGAGFDYHGVPLAILKGRIVAALLFGGYYLAGALNPLLGAAAFVVLMVVLPWLIVRSLRFRLHNSSYRGLRFRFGGDTRGAYWVFLGLGIASVLTLYALGPLWHQRLKRYMHTNAEYGRTRFTFHASVSAFYRIYLIAFGVLTALAAGAVVIALRSSDTAPPSVAVQLVPIAYAFVFVVVLTFIRARITNLVWNHTALGPHGFRCDLKASTMVFITITNLAAIVFTLGLYKPFAEVRLMNYVASTFTLVPGASLDEFLAGEQEQQIAATGDAAVEMFDIDVAF